VKPSFPLPFSLPSVPFSLPPSAFLPGPSFLFPFVLVLVGATYSTIYAWNEHFLKCLETSLEV